MPREQLLEQQELGVEVLLLGRAIDDGDARQRPALTGQTPFVAKHVDDALLEGRHAGQRGHHPVDRRTTGPLCPRQHRVEHRPAGVGVDLDQPEATLIQVKVVAEEHSERPSGAQPGDGWRCGQRLFPIGRQGHHRFDGPHHLCHALQLRRRDEYGLCCEEERTTQSNHFGKARLAEFGVQRSGQRILVEADAEARAVERVDGADGRPTVRRWRDSVHGFLRAMMLGERAIGADGLRQGSSRSLRRLFGGRRGGEPDAGLAFLCTPAHRRAVQVARTLPWRSGSSQALALISTDRERMPCRPGSTIEKQHHRTN